jgi:hypothetical protein
LTAREPTFAPALTRVKVLPVPAPLRARFCTGTARLATVIWLTPLPPLRVRAASGVLT